MSYESPIHLISDRMRIETEGKIIKAIQKVGVYVDKDELLKALAYDRDQYLKGYEDRDKELVRCGECKKQFTNNCYMIYGKNMMRNLFDNDFCSYGERRERDDKNTAEDKGL